MKLTRYLEAALFADKARAAGLVGLAELFDAIAAVWEAA
jgi:rubrerythrin